MPRISSAKDVIEFIGSMKQVTEPLRVAHALHCALGANYYSGRQWKRLSHGLVVSPTRKPLNAIETNWNPEATDLRVVFNEQSRIIQKWWAKTTPQRLEVDARPPSGHFTMDVVNKARQAQDALHALLPGMGALSALKRASFMRSWSGDGIVNLVLANGAGGERVLQWEASTVMDLVYDPVNTNPDLRRHEWLQLTYIKTLDELRNVFGIDVPEEQGVPMRTLAANYTAINNLSGWSVFPQYTVDLNKPAVKLHQLMWKTEPGERFDGFAMIVDGAKEMMVLGGELSSPFGGDGLPMVKLSCLPRATSAFSNGLTHAMMDRQDINNIVWTAMLRSLLAASAFKWMYDTRAISKEKFKSEMTNRIGGGVGFLGGKGSQQFSPPVAVSPPPVPAVFQRIAMLMPESMQSASHRHDVNFGVPSEREPAAGQRMRIAESDEVINHVMVNDEAEVSIALSNTLATQIRHLGPSAVRKLMARGMGEEQITALLLIDTRDTGIQLTIQPGSTQPRTKREMKQDLLTGVQLGSIDPAGLRREMALTLNQPMTSADRVAMESAMRVGYRILAGNEWPGRPGVDHDMYIAVFKLFLNDVNVQEGDVDARDRLERAIQAQQQSRVEEQEAAAGPIDMAQAQQGRPSLPRGAMENTEAGVSLPGGVLSA